jgi:hypothetical protein
VTALPITRRSATLLWVALLLVPVAFLVLVLFRGGLGCPHALEAGFWLAVGASALNVTLSRVLPARLGSARSEPHALAFTRLLVAWALCDAAAIAPLVAYTLTSDPRLLGVFAVDLLALVLLFPSDLRWESFAGADAHGAAPGRMVR